MILKDCNECHTSPHIWNLNAYSLVASVVGTRLPKCSVCFNKKIPHLELRLPTNSAAAGVSTEPRTNHYFSRPAPRFPFPAILRLSSFAPDCRRSVPAVGWHCVCFRTFFPCELTGAAVVADYSAQIAHRDWAFSDQVGYATQQWRTIWRSQKVDGNLWLHEPC